jgi:predicted aspartyl protease
MIHGIVNARLEATIHLELRGPSGLVHVVDAVIDSGYTSTLALPMATVAALGLLQTASGMAMMGDGSVVNYDIFIADVKWGNAWRTVFVSAVGNVPLVGMLLLADHKLVIDVIPGGLVEIIPPP